MAGAAVASIPAWRSHRRFALLAALPVAAALGVRAWRPDGQDPIIWSSLILVLVVSLTFAAALLVRHRWATPIATAILILAVIWDPAIKELATGENREGASLANSVHAYQNDDPASTFLKEREAAEGPIRSFGYDPFWLTLDGDQRTYHIDYRESEVLALIVNNRSIPLGLQDVQGYNPIQIQRYADFIEQVNGGSQSYHAANVLFRGATSPLLNLLNARYIIIPQGLPPGRPDLLHLHQRYPTVYQDERVQILERTDSLPRAWIVHRASAVTDAEAFRHLQSPSFDPRLEAMLPAGTELPPLGEPTDPSAESVVIGEHNPDRIELSVEMQSPGIVVLSEIWDPDWHVEIDGAPAKLYRVDTVLRGVAVPAGAHTIVVSYRSTMLLTTAVISGVGWAAVLLGALALVGRRLRFGARHDEEGDFATAYGTGAGGYGREPGSGVDPPGALVEFGNREPEPDRRVAPPGLVERGRDKRGSPSASGEIGSEA
jgi:hypothetical protein